MTEDYEAWLDYNVWGGMSCLDSHYLAVVLDKVLDVAVGSHEMGEVWESVMGGPRGIFVFGMRHPIRRALVALPVVEDYQEWLGDPDWHTIMLLVKSSEVFDGVLEVLVRADVREQAWSILRASVAASLDGSVWHAVWTVCREGRV